MGPGEELEHDRDSLNGDDKGFPITPEAEIPVSRYTWLPDCLVRWRVIGSVRSTWRTVASGCG